MAEGQTERQKGQRRQTEVGTVGLGRINRRSIDPLILPASSLLHATLRTHELESSWPRDFQFPSTPDFPGRLSRVTSRIRPLIRYFIWKVGAPLRNAGFTS